MWLDTQQKNDITNSLLLVMILAGEICGGKGVIFAFSHKCVCHCGRYYFFPLD
jgi:hypothetical protein